MERLGFLTWDAHREPNLRRPRRQPRVTGKSPSGAQPGWPGQFSGSEARVCGAEIQITLCARPGPVLRARSASGKGRRDSQPLGHEALPICSLECSGPAHAHPEEGGVPLPFPAECFSPCHTKPQGCLQRVTQTDIGAPRAPQGSRHSHACNLTLGAW